VAVLPNFQDVDFTERKSDYFCAQFISIKSVHPKKCKKIIILIWRQSFSDTIDLPVLCKLFQNGSIRSATPTFMAVLPNFQDVDFTERKSDYFCAQFISIKSVHPKKCKKKNILIWRQSFSDTIDLPVLCKLFQNGSIRSATPTFIAVLPSPSPNHLHPIRRRNFRD
jgi:hypothetical protein